LASGVRSRRGTVDRAYLVEAVADVGGNRPGTDEQDFGDVGGGATHQDGQPPLAGQGIVQRSGKLGKLSLTAHEYVVNLDVG